MSDRDQPYSRLLRRPSIIAGFGTLAVASRDLAELKAAACIAAAEGLGIERTKIAEPRGDGDLIVTVGVGWPAGIIGTSAGGDPRMPTGHAFHTNSPVVIGDLCTQDEYDIPHVLLEYGIVALLNVPIQADGCTYGVLEGDTGAGRAFHTDDVDFLSALAQLLAAAIQRSNAETALHASDAWLRQALDIGHMGTWTWHPASGELIWSDAIYRMLGYEPGSVAPSYDLFVAHVHPDDRAALEAALRRGLRSRRAFSGVFRIVRRDGSIGWCEARGLTEKETDGPPRMTGVTADVTERREAEERLQRAQDELLPEMLWRNDPSGAGTWSNRRWLAYTGQTLEQSLGRGWLDAVHPDDREATLREFKEAISGGRPLEHEHRIRGADGAYRWFLKRAEPVRDEHGAIVEWFGSETDIDDLKRLHEHQEMLIAELQHRTRNLLAVVRSMAEQTMRGSGSQAEFRGKFNSRLAALGRVQSLLSRGEASIDLGELVRTELVAHGVEADGERVRASGAAVPLTSKAVQSLALALHELTTNAVKHGALTQPQARLAVTWHVEGTDADPRIVLCWEESGVDLPASEQLASGFGRKLIEQALPHDLGADTSFAFAADGVRCRIAVPLEANP